jgi:hypothetical protein
MNENNKILERVLLMMKYDSSKTLKENSDVVKEKFAEQLNEAPPKIGGKGAKSTKGTKGTKIGGGLNLKLNQTQINQVKLFKSNFIAKNGRTPTQAEVRAFKNKAFGTPQPAPVPVPNPKSTGGKRGPKKPPTPKDKSILSRISNNIKNNKGRWAIGLIAGAGLTAAGIYIYLQPKVSPCLLDSLSEEELSSLGDAGTTGKITRKEIGNRFADKNGGLSFGLDNTTVTTGNGKYSGSYSCDGNNIKVSIAGMDFVIGGGGSTDKGTAGGGTSGGGGSQYKQCSENLPIAMYCKNSTVARVQGCIGVTQDGAFGPKTSAALTAKGADGSSITQATIDKVCGGGAKPEKLTTNVDTEDLGGTSNNDNVKSSDNSEDGIG